MLIIGLVIVLACIAGIVFLGLTAIGLAHRASGWSRKVLKGRFEHEKAGVGGIWRVFKNIVVWLFSEI